METAKVEAQAPNQSDTETVSPVRLTSDQKENSHMKRFKTLSQTVILRSMIRLRSLKDNTQGQDLIEYALMSGFVALVAGAIMPGVSLEISTIFSKVASVVTAAASQGS